MSSSHEVAPEAPQHPERPPLVLHVGVTGHRAKDLDKCDLAEVRRVVAETLRRVRATVDSVWQRNHDAFAGGKPILRLYSRLADGADLLVAEEAHKQQFDIHCALPMPRDAYEPYIDATWRPAYRTMLERADRVLELDGDSADGDEAFFESRRMVLRHSDVLIAIWDPEHCPSGIWGTTRLVEEARHDDLLVVHVPPDVPREAHLDMRAEVADIHGSSLADLEKRIRTLLEPPDDGIEANERRARWRKGLVGEPSAREAFFREHQPRWTGGGIWISLRNLMGEGKWTKPRFSVDAFGAAARADWESGWMTNPAIPESVRARIDSALFRPYSWADGLATYFANVTRSSIILNYVMAAFAVLLALLAFGFGGGEKGHLEYSYSFKRLCVVLELVLIVLIVANTTYGNARRWHGRWMDYRVLAERLRLQRFLAPLGRVTPHLRSPAHRSHGDIRGSWLSWYFRALVRASGMVEGRFDASYVNACRAGFCGLVGDERSGQISWHAVNAHRFRRIEAGLHRVGVGCFVLTFVSCVVHLCWHWPFLTMLCATLPAFGAAAAAIAMHLQLERVSHHSLAMAEGLERLREYLERQPPSSRHIGPPCEQIAEAMMTEVLDWRSLFRGTISLPA